MPSGESVLLTRRLLNYSQSLTWGLTFVKVSCRVGVDGMEGDSMMSIFE